MGNLFKAWHKEVKCWIKCNPCVFQEGQIGRWNSNAPFDFFKAEDIEIVRNSGVKDTTGKEIYEGDIVEFYNDVDYVLHPGIAKVIFDLGAFQMENEKYGNEYLGNMDIDDMCIRVIGNIYENPDLLKSKIEGEINGKSI